METNRLKQFCTIVEMGSLVQAAKLLHITHSGLSKSMHILQDEIGRVLFHSAGRGIAITEAGQTVFVLKHKDQQKNDVYKDLIKTVKEIIK